MNAVVETVAPLMQSPNANALMRLIEQAALNPQFDVAKLEHLLNVKERWEAQEARKAFDAAISLAKSEIKPILKNREVDFTSQRGRTNYVYEDLAQIASEVDPILAKYGLSYRFRPHQDAKKLTVTCIVSHRDGHYEESVLIADNDESGNKNTIQAVGSTATYLQRYTLKLALGLAATRDDDGRRSEEETPSVPSPDGYEDWKADMRALADEGTQKLQDAWSKSNPNFRRHVVKNDELWWVELKAKAAKVTQ